MKQIHFERFKETLYILKLKNGLTVHMLPLLLESYTTFVEVSIPFGGMHLAYQKGHLKKELHSGIAHFLEHKIFAMPEGDAFAGFSKLGADANAMTSYTQTSYIFSSTEQVIEALDYLLNMLDTPYFNQENVESEKKIINEELKMYLDDPIQLMQNKLLENMYHVHPIKYDIGGTIDSIEPINDRDLLDLYRDMYHPKNRLLTIAGHMDLKALTSYFKSYEKKDMGFYEKPKIIIPKEPKHLVKKHEVIYKPTSMPKMMLGVKLPSKNRKPQDAFKREMTINMFLNMLLGASSKPYEMLLEEKLINQNFFVQSTFEKGAEMILIYAESKKITTLKKKLIDLLCIDREVYLKKSTFDRFKKAYLGQFIHSLNHLETKVYLYSRFYHQGLSLFEVTDVLNEISYDDLNEVMNEIKANRISTLFLKRPKV